MVIEDLFVRLFMSCYHLPPLTGIPLSELENRFISGIFPLFIRNLIVSTAFDYKVWAKSRVWFLPNLFIIHLPFSVLCA